MEKWAEKYQATDLYFLAVSEAELRYGVAILPAGRRKDALALAIEAIRCGSSLFKPVLVVQRYRSYHELWVEVFVRQVYRKAVA